MNKFLREIEAVKRALTQIKDEHDNVKVKDSEAMQRIKDFIEKLSNNIKGVEYAHAQKAG